MSKYPNTRPRVEGGRSITRLGRVTLWLWNIHILLQKASLQRERYLTFTYQEEVVIEPYEQLRKIERKQKARVNEQEELKFLLPYGSRFNFLSSATEFRKKG